MATDIVLQAWIGACGLTAVFLSQDRREAARRWACIFGLCAQPAWFYATWRAEQWGIFGLSFLYTWSWARGFKYHWIDPRLR